MRGFRVQGSGFRYQVHRVASSICNLQFAICNLLRVISALTCLFLATTVASAETAVSIAAVRVGFAGHYRVGFWTPVEVTLRGGDKAVSGRLSLSAPDGDGISTSVTTEPIEVAPGGETRTMTYIKFGNLHSTLAIRFYDEEQASPLFERTFAADGNEPDVEFRKAFASTEGLILTLGNSIGIDDALGRSRDAMERINVVSLPDATQLPDEWLGYEGVNTLVVAPSPPLEDALAAGSRRLAALDRWLVEGGHLIFALGADSADNLSSDSPLARFLPGRLEGMSTLTRTTSLEMFGGTYGGAPLRWQRGERRGLAAARLTDVRGRIELAEGDFPLLVRRPYTFGKVTFLAVDFSRPPLADWAGRKLSVRRLLGQRTKGEANEDVATAPAAATHLGLVDLSGQLRSTLDQFRGVRLAPFWAVAALAAIYIALVGPIDFLLLKTLVRRMEWTWVTFPLIVLVFCGGAGWMAYRMKGDRLLINQIDLLDVDLASDRVRGTTWFNLFSPATSTYDLSLELRVPNEQDNGRREALVSWQGLPGNVLGGMEQGVSGPTSVARAYQFAPDRAELRNVPIPVWSTKSFVGRWQTQAGPTVDAKLKSGRDDVVEGAIVNRLGVPLKDCLLVAGRWAWQLPELPVDEAVPIRAGEQRDLLALLKDFKLVRERDKDTLVQVATPYDPASFNVRSILQQMMFYDTGNGRSYTGLLNRYQPYVDLSDHLEFGQAILWGQADQAAAAVRRDGQPLDEVGHEHETFYRFIIPLQTQ